MDEVMKYIYSRVSTDKQSTDNQLAELKAEHPDAAVFEEVASGAKSRPILKTLLSTLKEGDILIVYALDRLGRRTSEVLALIEDLERRKVVLRSKREGVDYSTICGKLVTQILCSVAEMERNLISERTKAALAAKRAQGIIGGRPAKYSGETAARVRELKGQGKSLRAISKETGVSTTRVFEMLKATS